MFVFVSDADAPSDQVRLALVNEDVDGSAQIAAPLVVKSPAADAAQLMEKLPVTAVPMVPVAGAVVAEIFHCPESALDGATATRLRPNAATATSAMRLIVVFVDICFLSISRVRVFPDPGFELIS
jgi:hypothetical protein